MTETQNNHGHQPAETAHGAVRYERKDIRLRLIVILVLVTTCFGAVHFFWAWQYFRFRKGIQERAQESPYSESAAVSSHMPPQPRLEQINRLEDVKSANVYERLAAQEKILHSYGPTEEKGFVHIPIDAAIKSVAGQLPVSKNAAKDVGADKRSIDSGESNSGRFLRGGGP